jgi:hypothetical protein
VPGGLISMLKRDSLRLLNTLRGYPKDGFIFSKGYGKDFLFKFSQTVRKQPMKGVTGCLTSHLDGARNA